VTTRYITAFEHQQLWIEHGPPEASITVAEANHLAQLGERRSGFCERGFRSVRLAQYCGLVSIGDRMIEILPKVDAARPAEECRGILLNLLRESAAFPLFRHLSAGHHLRRAPLLDVFVAAFFDEITTIVRAGLLRLYQERVDDLTCVRGRIVASRQFAAHANRTDRVACQYDDLTADNVWNRFLKAALRAVRPWIINVELYRRWVELMIVFDEVTDLSMEAGALRSFRFDRQANRYRSATEWARWILSLLAPRVRAGENAAPGLLFDMNLLFQSAVANALRRQYEHRQGLQVFTQEAGTHLAIRADRRKAFALRPDIIIRNGDKVVAIADTKWKRLEGEAWPDGGPSSADVYQMHAYASAYGCSRLTLVYPWHSGLRTDARVSYELSTTGPDTPILQVATVDVSRRPLPAPELL
jgi:5-methylcytosine-specific restriction enzyme subunit McrC